MTASHHKKGVLKIRKPEQIKAISSPERLRIVEILSERGPQTVKQLGEAMERVPQALYYHMKTLMAAGIVVSDGEIESKRRPEKRFRLAASKLKLDVSKSSAEFTEALGSAAASILRAAERNYREALQQGDPVLTGSRRNFSSRRHQVKLTNRQLAEFNRKLEELEDFLDELDSSGSGQSYAVTIVSSPLG